MKYVERYQNPHICQCCKNENTCVDFRDGERTHYSCFCGAKWSYKKNDLVPEVQPKRKRITVNNGS